MARSPSKKQRRFIPNGLSHAATAFVESLKINSINEKSRRGRRVIIKRRNLYGERVADCTVVLDKLPGRSLWDHMNAHALTARMLQAAGREYRRAHRIAVDEFGGAWSPAMGR